MVKGKGSSFERETCKLLSKWWTYDKREDVFWRTAGSGAMATTRNKTNQRAFGQYGDIQATDPIGQPLIDLCSIELKRGYSKNTFADLLDKMPTAKEQMYESFFRQAYDDSVKAGSRYWMLIAKRDRRETLVYIPVPFFKALKKEGCFLTAAPSYSVINNQTFLGSRTINVFILPLQEFLTHAKPKHIKAVLKRWTPQPIEEPEPNNEKTSRIFKCVNCDEETVAYSTMGWYCTECGTKYRDSELS